ncbi:MAG: M48 family metalloprotease, partial [Thermoplasmata archaeon]
MGSLNALRRSSTLTIALVFAALALFLLLILFVVDLVLQQRSFPNGFVLVVGLAILFIYIQWAISPAIVRWAIRERRPITPETNRWLYDTVVELAQQAGVPPPRIWESGDATPNAFVFGRTVRSSELVVTRGLLEQLNQDEIRAVLAHEIGHIRHRDVVIMTLVSAVPLLAYIVARAGFEVLRGGVRAKGKGAGQAVLILIVSAIVSYLVYL